MLGEVNMLGSKKTTEGLKRWEMPGGLVTGVLLGMLRNFVQTLLGRDEVRAGSWIFG